MDNVKIAPRKPIRAFLAIALPKEISVALQEQVKKLKKLPGLKNAAWVIPEKWHITLRFLGNITLEQVDQLAQRVALTAAQFSTFAVELKQCTLFPNPENPKLLALMPEPKATLIALSLALDKDAVAVGVPSEKRAFLPHITLCRLPRGRRDRNLALSALNFALPALTFNADKLIFFQSTPAIKNSHYTLLREFTFER